MENGELGMSWEAGFSYEYKMWLLGRDFLALVVQLASTIGVAMTFAFLACSTVLGQSERRVSWIHNG